MNSSSQPLEIGFGEVDITPQPASPGSFRVFDPIGLRALILRQGNRNLAFLSGDFFSFEKVLLDGVIEALRDIPWLQAEHILPAVSHCGGAPILFQSYIHQPCAELRAFGQEARFVQAAAEAVRRAVADLKPGRVGFSRIEADGLSYNRRSHNAENQLVMSSALLPYPQHHLRYGPLDPHVYVMRVDEDEAGRKPRPRGALIAYGCHALCNNDKLGNVSADYPHYAREVISRAWGGAPVHFAPGALGNVVPIDRGGRTYQMVGNSVGGMALAALERTVTHSDAPLEIFQSSISIPTYAAKNTAEAEQKLAEAKNGLDGKARLDAYNARRREEGVARIDYTLTRIRLGDAEMLHLPGEIFVETAGAIRAAAGRPDLIVLSGPTADVGYLCPAEAFQEGGMEPSYTSVDDTAEQLIREAAIALLCESRAAVSRAPALV
jgi:hypothetical protein